ncbi:MAG: hypothetical protein PQJ59_00025 [Spirochaetales bacterium]|nr:hypothetical protein [Spirochaetales bacterium]
MRVMLRGENKDCDILIEESLGLAKRIEAGESELIPLLNLLNDRIEAYEDSHFQLPQKVSPEEMMIALMEKHGDNQSAMTDIAPRTVINAIVNGKRKLTLDHIKRLCVKYNVKADWFI